MLRKILIASAVAIVALAIIISRRPDTFRLSRSTLIQAPPDRVFSQVNDFRHWEAWSPWAKLDPNSKATFEGAASGKGAVFKWSGNDKVGEGRQEIIESQPPSRILIKLDFIKPFAATNQTEFTFQSETGGTRATWTMSGHNNFIAKAFSLFMDCEKMVGPDFEKGLSNLKALVESQH